jgi:hypothetical protein
MKKYRVTELGFIGRLVHPGEIIEVDGPPPIGGLVPLDDEPVEDKPAARPKKSRTPPPADTGEEAEVI